MYVLKLVLHLLIEDNNPERLINMNLYLVPALVISLCLNVVLYIQLTKNKTAESTKIRWKERIGLNNPLTALIWAFLCISIVLSLFGLLVGLFNS
ncbi:hypothetical protein [Bacillus phage BUCT083]|nr:hypothetical protein [Bacillus phage BUCT083]